ncbi:MAG: rhodanese-like domain-containing protein [Flavobacteriales bacterium]|nr:MAG: rhodanese-like domain-containing protein [Flavobacteriales bacterium]
MRPFALLLAVALVIASAGCAAQPAGTIGAAALQAELRTDTVQLIDVRTPDEWSRGHIEGAVHIDWFSDEFKAQVEKLDKNAPVRLYCAAGGRSEEAREMLRGMGFRDVLDLDGGIGAWKKSGGAVVK